MLEVPRVEDVKTMLDALPCHVVLPPEWTDFHKRRGKIVGHGDDIRRFVRSHYPTRAIVHLKTTLPEIPRDAERHVVLMTTISRQGCSFLHFAQLFPGEQVELTLPTAHIPYTVVRCVRHNDQCFEIGAKITSK